MSARRERAHVTLFIPGTPDGLDGWGRAFAPTGLTLTDGVIGGAGLGFEVGSEWVENPRDGSFGEAFSFGTATDAEQAAIEAVPGALVLTLPVDLHRERAAIAGLARRLGTSGALAVRVEESKLGWPVARWVELVDGADPWSLYRAVVVMLRSGPWATTCGMHAFSLPDAQVALEGGLDPGGANALLGVLNVYQLAEDPVLVGGHTFSPDAASPRRVLRRWPDASYPPGHPCHNPFGVWRLGPAGGRGGAPELAFVFMPGLAVLLQAAEEQAGRPLTREQVEAIASKAVGITMPHRDAQRLERERGFADLDPALAWEQWQIVRAER